MLELNKIYTIQKFFSMTTIIYYYIKSNITPLQTNTFVSNKIKTDGEYKNHWLDVQ